MKEETPEQASKMPATASTKEASPSVKNRAVAGEVNDLLANRKKIDSIVSSGKSLDEQISELKDIVKEKDKKVQKFYHYLGQYIDEQNEQLETLEPLDAAENVVEYIEENGGRKLTDAERTQLMGVIENAFKSSTSWDLIKDCLKLGAKAAVCVGMAASVVAVTGIEVQTTITLATHYASRVTPIEMAVGIARRVGSTAGVANIGYIVSKMGYKGFSRVIDRAAGQMAKKDRIIKAVKTTFANKHLKKHSTTDTHRTRTE